MPEVENPFEAIIGAPPDGHPPFTVDNFKRALEEFIDRIPQLVTEGGDMTPDYDIPAVVAFAGPGGFTMTPIGEQLQDDTSKDGVAALIRLTTATYEGIHSVAMVCPAFIRRLTREQSKDVEGTLASTNAPPREEVVTFVIEQRNGVFYSGMSMVDRSEDKPPVFGEVKWDTPTEHSGRFAGFFLNSSDNKVN